MKGLRQSLLGGQLIAAILCLTLLLGSCSTTRRIAVRGDAWGTRLDTTVDAEVARYYVENYLAGKPTDPALHQKIDALHARHAASLPSREELKNISQAFSVDLASLFLADLLFRQPCNKEFNALFQAGIREKRKGDPKVTSAYIVLFVPGWDYEKNGQETGADFRRPRELATQFGFENHLVLIPPTGSVDENARVVANEIARRSGGSKKLIVVGASSAGPAIHLALSELVDRNAVATVSAWLNFGGILQGSPLVDFVEDRSWLLSALTWIMDWDKKAVLSMGTQESRARFARLHLPETVKVVNYLGVPLSGQLSRFGKDKYPLLAKHGPNDGLTLLTDALLPRSRTIVALGSDHFFAEDPSIDEKTVSLMSMMTTLLGLTETTNGRTLTQVHRVKACG